MKETNAKLKANYPRETCRGVFQLKSYTGILRYLENNPGSQTRDIAEGTISKPWTTRARLLRLQAEGLIRAERLPNAVLFYLSDCAR